ncbi:MAG: sorbosone dehydrogenase family protein, partial [Planctomycetota bacterium]
APDTFYVLEQGGQINRIAKWRGTGPVPKPTGVLDLTSKVFPRLQGGIMGMAFHPRFAQNHRAFVNYLAGSPQTGFRRVLAEFTEAGGRLDPRTERVLLEIPKSLAIHNAGWIAFGPDGMLYLSTGDNGKQKEAVGLCQNPNSLLGKILRIDVDRTSPGLKYAIPADNPWANVKQGVRREIWAYGMRNPWRFSFDAAGNLWTTEPGTKGPGCHEWVVKVQKGMNHGWPFFEGTRPIEPIPDNLKNQRFVPPVFEYMRGPEPDVTAGIGGVIYRESRMPALEGQYVFLDYSRGSVYSIDVSSGKGKDFRTVAKIPSPCALGEDAQGEIYVVSYTDGRIFGLTAGQ